MKPRISIIIPYYNGSRYINDTLYSVLNQTISDWECILVDDYSEEKPDKCISMKDPRIRMVCNKFERGMANARQYGCSQAQSEFIGLLDQDDLCTADRLRVQLNAFSTDKDLMLVGGWRRNFGPNNEVVRHETDYETIKIRLLHNSQFTNSTIAFRHDLISENELTFCQEMAPCDDYDFFCKAALVGKTANIPQVLVNYRIHNAQTSNTKQVLMEEKSNVVRSKYMLRLLKGFEIGSDDLRRVGAFFSSPNMGPEVGIEHIYMTYNYLIQRNREVPIFPERKWKSFLIDRFLHLLRAREVKRGSFISFVSRHNVISDLLYYSTSYSRIKNVMRSLI